MKVHEILNTLRHLPSDAEVSLPENSTVTMPGETEAHSLHKVHKQYYPDSTSDSADSAKA